MIQLSAPSHILKTSIQLSGSKSISNRLLVLNEVLNAHCTFNNISDSEDTLLLQKALGKIKNTTKGTIDIHHAGTSMRFLTAFLATKSGEWTLTGSERMKERPVGELVNALRLLGADITFLEKENYPPLLIRGKKLMGGAVEINGGISSQFVSALLLIAPLFKKGLEMKLKGEIVSRPYIDMTISLLQSLNLNIKLKADSIHVSPSSILHLATSISIESDWSSASYWYSICALSKNAVIELSGLTQNSLQADSVLPMLYQQLGVETTFKEKSIILSNKQISIREFSYDFISCPDIAQTIAVTCLGLGINANLTGLQTLKIKETNRIAALKAELEKFGVKGEITDNSIKLTHHSSLITHHPINIKTYNDHRMAMSFAPLALIYNNIFIQNPEVVSKSYPAFWEDLKCVGFSVNLQP